MTQGIRKIDRSRAFTLVELLVVLVIIGILAGLLLPVVMQARESARRLACEENLRQIGVAIGSYEMSARSFPYGCMEWRPRDTGPERQFAWSALILPYLDQTMLSNTIDFSKPFDHAVNAEAAKAKLPFYICPSVLRKNQKRGPSDYGGLYGQRITARRDTNNGVFIYNVAFRRSQVIDGESNTVAVGEDCAGPDSEWINGRNVFEQSGGINDPKAWVGDNELRSLHGGGAMTLFLDGSTHFLSNNLDRKTLGALITRAGRDLPGGYQ